MNYKSLLFTALAGVMITSACVKNLESPSVTKVREAKAAEMEAAAALNKANAEATVTLANANAALTLAKAEVEKANAAKIAAETELVRINAELARVNVEIAKVRVEEEKVQLEILKEQLEQEKVRTEQDKAYAEYLLKQYEQQMQQVIDQMELEALYHQIEMAKALHNLNDSLAEIDAENREAIANLYKKIAETQESILKKEVEILKAEMKAELMEAGLITAEEALNAELIRLETQAMTEQLYLDYLKEAEGLDSDTLMMYAKQAEIESLRQQEQLAVDEAAELEANKAYNVAVSNRSDLYDKYYSKLQKVLYSEDWYRYSQFGSWAYKAGYIINYGFDENGTWGLFVTKEDGTTELLLERYQYDEDAHIVVPAKLNANLMTEITDAIQAQFAKWYEAASNGTYGCTPFYAYDKDNNSFVTLERYPDYEQYDPIPEMTYQEWYDLALKQYNLALEANKELLEERENAKNALEEAIKLCEEATEARKEAYITFLNNGGASSKVDDYEDALNDYEHYYKNDYEPAQEEFGKHPSVDAAKDALHEAKKAVIAAWQAVEKAEADAAKPREKKTDAKKAMEDSLRVAQTLEDAYQDALDAQRKAELTYLKNPKSETAKKAFEDAKKATAEALKAADDAQAAYAEARAAYNKAAADYQPYEEKVAAARDNYSKATEAVSEAEKEVTACVKAKENWERVQNGIKGYEEDLDEKYAAMVAEEGNEYYLAYCEAAKAESAAYANKQKKQDELDNMYDPTGMLTTLERQVSDMKDALDEPKEEYDSNMEKFATIMDEAMEAYSYEEEFIAAIQEYNDSYDKVREAHTIVSETQKSVKYWTEQQRAFETAAGEAGETEAKIAASEAKIAEIEKKMITLVNDYNKGLFSVLYFEEHIKVYEAELAGLKLQLEGYQAELEARLANL